VSDTYLAAIPQRMRDIPMIWVESEGKISFGPSALRNEPAGKPLLTTAPRYNVGLLPTRSRVRTATHTAAA